MNAEDAAARREKLRALRAKGLSVRAIATDLGVGQANVYRILGVDRVAAGEQTARARFPALPPGLAVRLAQHFADDAAVAAAEDRELLSMRGMSAAKLRALRLRYPHSSSGD
jgi:hypothetical protein